MAGLLSGDDVLALGDEVLLVHHAGVESGAAFDVVRRPVVARGEHVVVALLALELVLAVATEEPVVALAGEEEVIASPSSKRKSLPPAPAMVSDPGVPVNVRTGSAAFATASGG